MISLEHLRTRLLQQAPDLTAHDDYDLDPAQRPVTLGGSPAAVLLLLILADEPRLLFTRRTDTLSRHGGQVSFPGGRREAQDVSAIETALRETMEETGITPGFVTVAGYLDRYLTGTGFDIQPVVGVLAPGYALAPDPSEVAEVFAVPLAFLRDPANRRRETRVLGGRQRSFYAYTYQEHEIWGATAAIVVGLVQRLDAISPA